MEGDIEKKLLEGEKEEEGVALKDKLWKESGKMWVVAGPAIFTRFSMIGISVISLAFIGHIGATELAAFSVVNTVFLRFANGILVSLAQRHIDKWFVEPEQPNDNS